MNKARAFRLLLIAIAGFGCLAGARLSLQHLQHGEVCPMLGPIPACFIVFAGYLFVVLAAIGSKRANVSSRTDRRIFRTHARRHVPVRTYEYSAVFLFTRNGVYVPGAV